MNSDELLIIVLEAQIKLLQRLVSDGKRGDMERMIIGFKKRVKELNIVNTKHGE